MDSDRRDIIVFVIIGAIFFAVICGVIFLNSLKEKTRIEKECAEEHMTFTSEIFKCPDGKPFVHLSVFNKRASAMCCAKD